MVGPRRLPANETPTTPEGLQALMLREFNTALALFLLVAEDNVWWGYSWFWGVDDFTPFGTGHTCPDGFYPQLKCPLGAPLGPAAKVGSTWRYMYQREFGSATVTVDLHDRAATGVQWKSPQCAHFNTKTDDDAPSA